MLEELSALADERCPQKRSELLRQVTKTHLEGAGAPFGIEKYLLGDMIDRIVSSITKQQRLVLCEHCDMHAALARRLAADPDIDVAKPVLRNSSLLSDDDLVEIGRSAPPEHLVVIAQRPAISEMVTDVLIERDHRPAVHALTANAGARLSTAGMDRLIEKASEDIDLRVLLVDRPELTQEAVDRLLPLATAALVVRLADRGFSVAGSLSPDMVRDLRQGFAAALRQRRRNVLSTKDLIEAVRGGRLGIDEAVWTVVVEERLLDVTTLLSNLAGIDRSHLFGLIAQARLPALLIVFRAVGLGWHAAEGVFVLIARKRGTSVDTSSLKRDYDTISSAMAQRALRFFKVRRVAEAA